MASPRWKSLGYFHFCFLFSKDQLLGIFEKEISLEFVIILV